MKTRNKLIISCMTLIFSVTSCNLDINVDPNSPATVPSGQLLSSAEVAIFTSFGHNGSGLGQPASIWVHQVMIRSNADGYASTGTDANINNPWLNLYAGALEDLETIINQAKKNGEFGYSGIAKILKAYTFHMMVDAWGDIPYSEALRGTENPFPKFDDDATIYPSLFVLLDEGIADLATPSGTTSASPGSDDLIYGGDLVKWRRFAKAIKLKMYNTIKGVENVANEINALIGDSDIKNFGPANDFELNYFNVAAPENRNPAWVSVSGVTTYFSRYFYEIMNGKSTLNPIMGTIVDPRLPYYLYNSLGTTNQTGNNNPIEYRDTPYPLAPPPQNGAYFVSINFSSQSPAQGFDQSRTLSMPGVYFCGGRLDLDNAGGAILISSAPGNAPQRLFNSFSLNYILAEIHLTKGSNSEARTAFSTAIDQSFAKVNSVKQRVYPTAPDITSAASNAYRTAVLAIWDGFSSSSNTQKLLELIMTQKWIANFGNSLDSYSDYRRTGYPIMFDPNNDGDPNTNLGRNYPFSFPYRQLDLQQNKNAPAQKLIGDNSARVFWDNN
ncbi:MAG: SusD/RagB family nutrient-binding outer membrane lipoprotein [Flammeovirgaceae bacterium]